jgi:hypothetical protein
MGDAAPSLTHRTPRNRGSFRGHGHAPFLKGELMELTQRQKWILEAVFPLGGDHFLGACSPVEIQREIIAIETRNAQADAEAALRFWATTCEAISKKAVGL